MFQLVICDVTVFQRYFVAHTQLTGNIPAIFINIVSNVFKG